MWTSCYSTKWTGPSSTNSVDNVDAGMPLAQDCLAPVTDSSTGHYNNAGTDSSSLWLIFLASIQQGRAIERVYEALMSMQCRTYQKYTKSHRSRNTFLLRTF